MDQATQTRKLLRLGKMPQGFQGVVSVLLPPDAGLAAHGSEIFATLNERLESHQDDWLEVNWPSGRMELITSVVIGSGKSLKALRISASREPSLFFLTLVDSTDESALLSVILSDDSNQSMITLQDTIRTPPIDTINNQFEIIRAILKLGDWSSDGLDPLRPLEFPNEFGDNTGTKEELPQLESSLVEHATVIGAEAESARDLAVRGLLARLKDSEEAIARERAKMDETVAMLREFNVTWAAIGESLGITGPTVRQRFTPQGREAHRDRVAKTREAQRQK